MTDPTCDCCWRPVTMNEHTSNCFCVGHGHGTRRPMTDHVDHQARTREIEARLEAAWYGSNFWIRQAGADLRYLLDRVRAQDERIEALETIGKELVEELDTAVSAYLDCREIIFYENAGDLIRRAQSVLTLPAPETLETP